MPSVVAWLDASAEQQRKMREIVNLFMQAESRDELGVGQVRDAFSDLLFPGTSTLHTRARYLLFVPWSYVAADRPNVPPAQRERRVQDNERALIAGLKDLGDVDGLIGRVAGVGVKTLPSALYWTALRQFGILRAEDPLGAMTGGSAASVEDELADLSVTAWAPTLPPIPPGFPRHPEVGFDLSRAEATWLQERILAGTEGTLLHHLAGDNNRPGRVADSPAPWADVSCAQAPADVREVVHHAELLSLSYQGAALLYNLLIGRLYEDAGYTKIAEPVERYEAELDDWVAACNSNASALRSWDRQAFWGYVTQQNPRIHRWTRRFLDEWLDRVCSLEITNVASDPALEKLIARQERTRKKTQSRLDNKRLLQAWSGAAGTRAMTYRWAQVNGLLQDLHDGLERDDAAA